jgi:hypothetical protein
MVIDYLKYFRKWNKHKQCWRVVLALRRSEDIHKIHRRRHVDHQKSNEMRPRAVQVHRMNAKREVSLNFFNRQFAFGWFERHVEDSQWQKWNEVSRKSDLFWHFNGAERREIYFVTYDTYDKILMICLESSHSCHRILMQHHCVAIKYPPRFIISLLFNPPTTTSEENPLWKRESTWSVMIFLYIVILSHEFSFFASLDFTHRSGKSLLLHCYSFFLKDFSWEIRENLNIH